MRIIVSLAIALSMFVPAHTQMRRGGGPEYNVTRETTLTGTMVKTYLGPFEELLILEITTGGEPLHLLLAPPAVVKKMPFDFKEGARVDVIGNPGFKVNGNVGMLVRELKSGKQMLTLRDKRGKPVWN